MGRDLAIDATRGVAIWSMVSLHFANGMLIARPTHTYPLVDGMSAFVLLSGLVLGIVYRGWCDRYRLRYAYHRLAQRLLVLYVAQVAISLTAVLVATRLSGAQYRMIAVLPPDTSFAQQLWWALTLRFLPGGGSVLAVYLVLMTFGFAVLPVLARGGWAWVLGASAALYVYSQVSPAWWMLMYSWPDGGPIQNWAAWQILFVPAMVLGWKWSDWAVPERLDANLGTLVAATGGVGLLLLSGLRIDTHLSGAQALLSKIGLGPLRALTAWLVVITVYAVFRRVLQWIQHGWFRPLIMVGARSLDAYVIQAVALLAIPTWIVCRPWGPGLSTVIVLAVFGACWGWAEFRRHRGIDKLHEWPTRLIRTRLVREAAGGRHDQTRSRSTEHAR